MSAIANKAASAAAGAAKQVAKGAPKGDTVLKKGAKKDPELYVCREFSRCL